MSIAHKKTVYLVLILLALSVASFASFSYSRKTLKVSIVSTSPLKVKIENAMRNSILELYKSNNLIKQQQFDPIEIPSGSIYFYRENLSGGNYKLTVVSGRS